MILKKSIIKLSPEEIGIFVQQKCVKSADYLKLASFFRTYLNNYNWENKYTSSVINIAGLMLQWLGREMSFAGVGTIRYDKDDKRLLTLIELLEHFKSATSEKHPGANLLTVSLIVKLKKNLVNLYTQTQDLKILK